MNQEEGLPWWKFGLVWMVFAGPAVVVVASFITIYLAIKIPDPVVSSYGRPQSSESTPRFDPGSAPAMQARNHAATGVQPPAKP